MSENFDAHRAGRRHPAAGVLRIPHEQTLVYLTVTTDHRRTWLAAEEPHRLLVDTWRAARGWLVGYYILMPDHLHCLCAPGAGNFTIERWLSYWKDQFGKKHRHEGWDWQSRGWHHRLCAAMKAWKKNGTTCGAIPSCLDWSRIPTTGHGRESSTTSDRRTWDDSPPREGGARLPPRRLRWQVRRPRRSRNRLGGSLAPPGVRRPAWWQWLQTGTMGCLRRS